MGGQEKHNLDNPILRIVRIARGLEEQLGSYAGRLWWAAAYSHLMQSALQEGIPSGRDEIVEQMEGMLADLRALDFDPELLAALERSRALVKQGDKVRWNEFEHVLVCRHCGAGSVGDREAACPSCGAGWITRRSFRPIWFLESLETADLIDALATTPRALESAAQGLPEAKLRMRPEPDEWSLREVFEHLWLAQELMWARIERMLNEEKPEFSGVTVETEDSAAKDTAELLREFSSRRSTQLAELAELGEKGWGRQGWHDEFGAITVRSQASYMARHEHHHLRQVRDIRSTLNA